MKRLWSCVGFALLLAAPSWAAEARIDLELITTDEFPPTGAQPWIERLKVLPNTSLRIRAASSGERELVENRGTEQSPRYHVVGVLTSGDRLRLPGAEFAARDRAGIANWFEKLRQDGIPGLAEKPTAFGLNSQQLVQFHERVSPAISWTTQGKRPGEVARQVVRDLGLEFEVTRQATDAFQRNATVSDELQGLSSGTALAAVLRPWD